MAGLGNNLLKILGGDTNLSLITVQLGGSQGSTGKGNKHNDDYFPNSKKEEIKVEKVRMYTEKGKEKIYTENIYVKSINGFGIEIQIANHTRYTKSVRCGCCVYDPDGCTKFKKNANVEVKAKHTLQHRFFVRKEEAIKLERGRYKVQVWMGSEKIGKISFNVM